MSDYHHHGHSHGGDGPPWFDRIMLIIMAAFVVLFLFSLIGLKAGWLK